MNARTLLAVVVLILVAGFGLLLVREGAGSVAPVAPSDISLKDRAYAALPGASVTLPERPEVSVAVSKNADGTFGGTWEDPVDPSDRAFLSFTKEHYFADAGANADQSRAILLPFYVNYGGTGTFLYAGLFDLPKQGLLVYRDAVLIDDRVFVTSLDPSADTITLKFLTRHSNEGMAAEPTVPAWELFTHEGHVLKVLMRGENADMDAVRVDTPLPNTVVQGAFQVAGSARGWYFEAQFPVRVTDPSGTEIAKGVAKAQGDWATSNSVPFVADISVGAYKGPAILILMKDNPSGDPKRDASVQIPIEIR